MKRIGSIITVLALVASVALPVKIASAETNVTLVSAAVSGNPYKSDSIFPVMSADGNAVLFMGNNFDSLPDKLDPSVAEKPDAGNDYFVRNLTTNTTKEINATADGREVSASTPAGPDQVSGAFPNHNGTKAVFVSTEDVDATDSNGLADVYMKDITTGALAPVTKVLNGQDRGAEIIDIIEATPSLDYLLLQVNTNSSTYWQHGVHYYVLNTTTLEATQLPYAPPSNGPRVRDISDDGRYVAVEKFNFIQEPSGSFFLGSAYRYDVQTSTELLVSVDANGTAVRGNHPRISSDGTQVVFVSDAHLDLSSPANLGVHVYKKNLTTGQITWVDKSDLNGHHDYISHVAGISGNGETVSFYSRYRFVPEDTSPTSPDLYAASTENGTIVRLTNNNAMTNGSDLIHASLSADGAYAAYTAVVSPAKQVYRKNLDAYFNTPSAPTDLTAPSPTASAPELTWQPVIGAATYNIYRNGELVGSTSATMYIDDSVSDPGDYEYQVTAVNGGGTESPFSNAVQVLFDNSAPTISNVTWSNNPLPQGQNTTLTVTAADVGSGVIGVAYQIDGGTTVPLTFNSVSDSWSADFGANLAVNTYNIDIVATDAAGSSSQPLTDVLAVYNVANGYVTGHAKALPDGDDVLPIALDTQTGNKAAQLVVGFTNIKPTAGQPTGSFDISYVVKNNQNEFSISSTFIDWVVVPDATRASILGHANLSRTQDGVTSQVNNVSVRFDITLGVSGADDHINVKIYEPGVNPATGAPTWTINADAIANKSNIKIKQ